ncbi:MAG TPA: histidine kinase, partial [Panacibacter sp.]|nr:histidine kinase [Panacibacter sp.]
LWIGTENGIYSFNKQTHELKRNFHCSNKADSSFLDIKITKLDVLNKDSIWFVAAGRGMGCYHIKTGSYTIYAFRATDNEKNTNGLDITDIQRKNSEEYYVTTEHRLPGVFNTITHQYNFSVFTAANLPSIVTVNHFIVDSSGNFWCILFNRLFHAQSVTNKFGTVSIDDEADKDKQENNFRTITWDNKNKYYYGCFEKSDKIFVLDSNLKQVSFIPVASENNNKNNPEKTHIYFLGLDNLNRLWACGSDLYIYNNTIKKLVPSYTLYPKLKFQNQLFQNLVFRKNFIFLQPSNPAYRAIYRVNLNTMDYDSIPLPEDMITDNVNVYQRGKYLDFLLIDKEGVNAYMGFNRNSIYTYDNGVIQYNLLTRKARKVKSVRISENERFTNLMEYALDDNNNIWIERGNGVEVVEPINLKTVKTITPHTEQTIQLKNIDKQGIMCRLNSNGIMLYDYKNNNEIPLDANDGLISYQNSGSNFVNNLLFIGAQNYLQYISLSEVINAGVARQKCYLSSISVLNQPYKTDTLPQYLHNLTLPHDKNFITLTFSSTFYNQPEHLEYRYKLSNINNDWQYVNYLNRTITYNDLQPGNYNFYAEIKNTDGSWSNDGVRLYINIIPAWWQTIWFKLMAIAFLLLLGFFMIRWRIAVVRKQEQEKAKQKQEKARIEKEILELEAKALRAQMNPHFIFNCMNSIKALIQENDQDKAVIYLTTFSKLLRTIFQNSDKREISLHDEIETCRLYMQLESMRFGNKFTYQFNVDESIDLKSIMVPALIIQPFIENAIWHGIMPKENSGSVNITVEQKNNFINCIIDDNGIGREMSRQNKFQTGSSTHQSKGVHLTQSRLNLDNVLNERSASVEIIDKKNANDKSEGTVVIISFKE